MTAQPTIVTEDQADRSIPVTVTVKTLDLKGKNFLSQYRPIVLFKRALTEPHLTGPDEVERAVDFLVAHITSPVDPKEARALVEEFNVDQILDLFQHIAGQVASTPNAKSDGNSEST